MAVACLRHTYAMLPPPTPTTTTTTTTTIESFCAFGDYRQIGYVLFCPVLSPFDIYLSDSLHICARARRTRVLDPAKHPFIARPHSYRIQCCFPDSSQLPDGHGKTKGKTFCREYLLPRVPFSVNKRMTTKKWQPSKEDLLHAINTFSY